MPAFVEEVAPAPAQAAQECSILKQRVDLDVNFAGRSVKGSTEITIQPLVKDLKQIKLHCRQCKPTAIQAGGITAKYEYEDPYRRSHMPEKTDVHQHDMLKSKIESSLRPVPEPELTIILPPRLKIQELHVDAVTTLPQYDATPSLQKQESDAMAIVETPTVQVGAQQQQGPQFAPLKLFIEFEVVDFRDGIHWMGLADGDRRYPCMYTKAEPWAGNSSCIFPCVDDATSRCSWEIAISCYRTVRDAIRMPKPERELPNGHAEVSVDADIEMANGADRPSESGVTTAEPPDEYIIDMSDEDMDLDLAVVCVGDLVDDVADSEDETRRTVTFNLTQPVCARHIGFAIGPFEHVDLSSTRASEEEERLGQSAVKVNGYCLPGKSQELCNTCYPISWAIDELGVKYGSFPFSNFQLLFVDDFAHDTVATAGLSFCTSHLLFPKTIIEPMVRNTRTLVRTLADQWAGVHVIANEPQDAWVVAGIAGFMTDLYMKKLAGNNEFRWKQKLAAEKVYELDVDRPSIRQLGELLHLDRSIREFVDVKAALVLFILDRRLMKSSGSTGVTRIINKIFLNAKTGALVNGELSTADFQRTCERLGHNKLESFFRQWVFHSGCPIFYVTQRFNKKKLCVEMTIVQKQLDRVTKPPFGPSNFMREVKEHVHDVWAPETNPVFTGPMTIRIHEADGTPYEHIVEIKEATTKLEIPYNTKYKRLKRSRRQKERQVTEGATNPEGGDDALLYCLGDILDSEEERREWDLMDWTAEDEEKMGQESYEWIRMDADFEWIGKIHLVMPLYMYISQLQQDRDIVAQYESMRYLLGSNPHHVSLSILLRTLMDSRYFWGIREMAAEGLAMCAKDRWREVGTFHLMKAFRSMFCIDSDSNMPKTSDFSDRLNFLIQCAIPRAMAKLRDGEGKVPMEVRQFFVDLLKFNDNSNNTFDDGDSSEEVILSDNHYIATLMSCLADSLIASHREPQPTYTFTFGDVDEPMVPKEDLDAEFEKLAIAQIERHRRVDEFDPSYHNVYSITALDCLQRLTKAGIVKDKTAEVMKYVRQGNAENVRLAAFRCLSEIGVMRKMSAMKYLLHSMADDPSPRFRDGLLNVLGEALGHIALGDSEPAKVVSDQQPVDESGLVLEQEVSSEAKRLEATRKTTPEGAFVALKAVLENEVAFKQALWYAATSPDMMLDEVAACCDIAALMYEPVNSLSLSVKLPRMWRCENLGSGKVRFTSHGPYRGIPKKELSLADWQRLQDLGLSYTGPLSDEILRKQRDVQQVDKEIALKQRIALTQQQLAEAQNGRVSSEMPPPIAITSTERPVPERQQSVTLKLSSKRKQSIDLGMAPRAGSPKALKISRQQTPTGGAVQTPRAKGSPAALSKRRSSTPGSKSSASKAKGKKIVVLPLGSKAARAQEILSSPPQPGRITTNGLTPNRTQQASRSITPVLPKPGAFPPGLAQSPTNSMNFFASPMQSQPVMNLGGFRSYGPTPDAPANSSEVKQESNETTASPVSIIVANGNMSPPIEDSQAVSQRSPAESMPPPPKKKLTLKLGARKPSSQGSPE